MGSDDILDHCIVAAMYGASMQAPKEAAMTYTSSNRTATTLTMDSIKQTIKAMEESERKWQRENLANVASGLYNPFGAIHLRESPLATTESKPTRLHKRRRGQSAAYHKRVQKKWDKRFGKVATPCAFVLDGGRFGPGSILVVHPSIAKSIRERIPVRSA